MHKKDSTFKMNLKVYYYCNLFEIQFKIQDLRLYYSTANQLSQNSYTQIHIPTLTDKKITFCMSYTFHDVNNLCKKSFINQDFVVHKGHKEIDELSASFTRHRLLLKQFVKERKKVKVQKMYINILLEYLGLFKFSEQKVFSKRTEV